MEATPRVLEEYQTEDGIEPFSRWLSRLRDGAGRGVIRTRLNRLKDGNFSNCESLGGNMHELKIDFGPGYRVYFGLDGNSVILLNGGDKDSQQRDIDRARGFWEDYNA